MHESLEVAVDELFSIGDVTGEAAQTALNWFSSVEYALFTDLIRVGKEIFAAPEGESSFMPAIKPRA